MYIAIKNHDAGDSQTSWLDERSLNELQDIALPVSVGDIALPVSVGDIALPVSVGDIAAPG
jgi:hypothetical protein